MLHNIYLKLVWISLFQDKPWVYAHLLEIQRRVGRENFPLIDQVFYPSHRDMVSSLSQILSVNKNFPRAGSQGKLSLRLQDRPRSRRSGQGQSRKFRRISGEDMKIVLVNIVRGSSCIHWSIKATDPSQNWWLHKNASNNEKRIWSKWSIIWCLFRIWRVWWPCLISTARWRTSLTPSMTCTSSRSELTTRRSCESFSQQLRQFKVVIRKCHKVSTKTLQFHSFYLKTLTGESLWLGIGRQMLDRVFSRRSLSR